MDRVSWVIMRRDGKKDKDKEKGKEGKRRKKEKDIV
jgi:hypothetical protein